MNINYSEEITKRIIWYLFIGLMVFTLILNIWNYQHILPSQDKYGLCKGFTDFFNHSKTSYGCIYWIPDLAPFMNIMILGMCIFWELSSLNEKKKFITLTNKDNNQKEASPVIIIIAVGIVCIVGSIFLAETNSNPDVATSLSTNSLPIEKCSGLNPRDQLDCEINPNTYKPISNIKCETGTYPQTIDIGFNPVLERENIETDCVPTSTDAKFWHDWYNGGCLWMSKHTEWATHISKMRQVNGTLFVCNQFDRFMTSDNKYGYQQVGMTGEQYVKSECVDLATEVDGQCYTMIGSRF